MGDIGIMSQLTSGSAIAPCRLLIPIDASEATQWPLRYAMRLARAGEPIEVCLLYVMEPVRDWEVLKYRTEEEVRRHFQVRSKIFLDEAITQLGEAGIAAQAYFRECDLVFGILDMAEELQCSEIAAPKSEWFGLLSSGVGRRLSKAKRSIPVTLVQADGTPEG
jgi:hypothetical protein